MATSEQIEKFNENGYLVIPEFLNSEEIQLLKSECSKLINEMNPSEDKSVFISGRNQKGEEYFLTSGDKIRYFFEEDAINEKGEFTVSKEDSLNKIGHALHWWNDVFKKITFGQKVKNLIRNFGFIDPLVVQSMYIFKNPKVGGKVECHQDATYLYTDPVKLLGLWFPLEDTTLENGCLWFLPGSHKGEVYQRYICNSTTGASLISASTAPIYTEDEFVPAVVSKGSCVLIHGKVIHKSEKNLSSKPRPAYTFHIIENHNTIYSKDNWLQPTNNLAFPSLYKTNV
ncbi:phytanoyl-CoA dioxygenase domain-containing protein 1-like [Centruroides vittatus]|uniref:phytanoyl-CoA dioxygenase domain-containing protein 1-like n=1 Tax=Centruroides vittatus TaxID=120091 RepID=UPI00350F8C16